MQENILPTEPTHVCVRFLNCFDNKYKNCETFIEDIFFDKRSKNSIKPTNVDDFIVGHEYKVYYRSCGQNCNVMSKCCSFYKALIICLGCKYFTIIILILIYIFKLYNYSI